MRHAASCPRLVQNLSDTVVGRSKEVGGVSFVGPNHRVKQMGIAVDQAACHFPLLGQMECAPSCRDRL